MWFEGDLGAVTIAFNGGRVYGLCGGVGRLANMGGLGRCGGLVGAEPMLTRVLVETGRLLGR